MKKLLLAVSTLTCVFMLAACGATAPENGTLYVYNWGEYNDPETVKMFEEEFDVKVVYDLFDSNETAYQKIKAGGTSYDVAVPSDYMIEKMVSENMLMALDYDKIPNMKYVDPALTGLDFDPETQYSVPYFWGTVGIVYDKTKVTEPVTSWSVLWDEAYANDIYMYNSQRDSLMVALKSLGYSMNTKSVDELQEAKALLIEQAPLVYAYVTDQVIEGMIQGNAALGVVYSGDATYIMDSNEDMEFVVPAEGSNLWVDAMVIPQTSKNTDLAHEFINFMMRPDIAAMNSAYVMYSTPNVEAAEELSSESWAQTEAYNPDTSKFNNMESFLDPGDFISEYDRIWTEVLAETNK